MDIFSQALDLGILTEFFDGQGVRHVTDEAALKIIIDAFPEAPPRRLIDGGVVIRCGLPARSRLHDEAVKVMAMPEVKETVLASVKRTGRALIVHEAQLTAGFGAEVAARLADAAFPWLDAPIRRVTYPDRPVPYAKSLEKVLLPDKGKVVRAARELMGF